MTSTARTLRSIRRHRVASVVGAAAVVTLVVATTTWLSGGDDATGSAHPATPTPAGGVPQSIADLPVGDPVRGNYIVGNTYVSIGGDALRLPHAGAVNATQTREGLVVAARSAGHAEGSVGHLSLVIGTSTRVLGCGATRFAVSTDQTMAAYWVQKGCDAARGGSLYASTVRSAGDAGPAPDGLRTPAGRVEVPVGILGTYAVLDGRTLDDLPDGVWLATSSRHLTRFTILASAGGTDANNHVISGQLASDPATGVVASSSGAVLWRRPGWVLGQFSADGRYVVGVRPGSERPDILAVFDAHTGTRVVVLPGPDPRGSGYVWDDDTLLSVIGDGTRQAIVRTDLKGTVTLASKPRPDDGSTDYVLTTRP